MAKRILFWVTWLVLVPFVLGVFLVSDLVNGRFRYPTCWLKTGLVRRSVYERVGLDLRKQKLRK